MWQAPPVPLSYTAGSMLIDVYTHKMDINLDENGGTMDVAYTLDFDSQVLSENTFKITVNKK